MWGSAALPPGLGDHVVGVRPFRETPGGTSSQPFLAHTRAPPARRGPRCAKGGAPPGSVPGQDVPLTQSPTINGAIYIRPRVGVKVGISVPRELALYPSNYSPVPSLRLNPSVFEHPPCLSVIDVLKVRKRFVWIREKAQKPRMVLNLLPVSLPKFTTLRA